MDPNLDTKSIVSLVFFGSKKPNDNQVLKEIQMKTTTLSIDIAKEKFHIFGVDQYNKVTIDKAISRNKLMCFIANHPVVDIFMESCAGSNFLCKKFNKMGHNAKRISAQHVKPYASHQKNDRNDAKAILEASRRPGALFVHVKSEQQQDIQILHKIRDQKLKQYRAIIGQIRGFLFEYGILIPKSATKFKNSIPEILEDAELSLSGIIRNEIQELFLEFKTISLKIKEIQEKLEIICEDNDFYKSAINELKGVGSIVASRYLSVINHASDFKNGRQVSAHLGLVPKQNSSGGKTKLGGITKHGDVGLRTLLIQGARASLAVLSIKKHLDIEDLKLKKDLEVKGFNKTAVKLANRNARRMWAIMKKCA